MVNSTFYLYLEIIWRMINYNVIAILPRTRMLICNSQTLPGSSSESLQRRRELIIILLVIIVTLI